LKAEFGGSENIATIIDGDTVIPCFDARGRTWFLTPALVHFQNRHALPCEMTKLIIRD